MSKYEKFSKEELVALVEKQDGELASKKYGLVWDSEREPEQVVLDCEQNLPVLKRVKGKEIREPKGNGVEDNILIEGDNYHALTVLNYTHPESVDVIYIDPPYNTGNQDFKYNDKFVDKEDGFRHSKWLNFMEKRLNLAKDLLKKTGVIFISIDDNEQAQLKMLCDKIFGEANFVTTIIWQKKYSPQNDAKYFSNTHDFILVYAKKRNYGPETDGWIRNILSRTDEQNARYKNPDLDLRGSWKAADFSVKTYSKAYDYPIETPSGRIVNPPQGRSWSTSKDNFEQWNKDNRIWFGKNGNNVPSVKVFLSEVQEGIVPTTIWMRTEVDDNQKAKQEIKEILNADSPFETPKPVRLLARILEIGANKNSTILDFFAGSGTTGHAVLELNKEDGGNRKFILCTNNELNGLEKELREKGISEKEIQEHGICRSVTYPRLQKVIKGYKKNGDGEKVEGLRGNLQYFKTDLLKQTKNKDQVRIDLTYKCTEMLCVKEGIFNLEVEKEDYKIFSSNAGDRFLGVYYNLFDDSFADFLKELKKLKGPKVVYMFSIDGNVEGKLFAGVKDCTVQEIPQKIVEIYRRLVKMNIPVKADTIFLDFNKAQKKIFEEGEKDDGARILRIVLEKTIQKIAQKNNLSIFKDNHKEEKVDVLNTLLKEAGIFSKVQWEENKTYLAIGNHAAHGDYSEYTIKQVENFYRHVQSLFNDFGI